MPVTRTRTRSLATPATGRYRNPVGNWVTQTASGPGSQTTVDVLGNRKGINPFTSTSYTTQHIFIDGYTTSLATGNISYIFEKCPTFYGNSAVRAHGMASTVTSSEANSLALQAVAQTNINASRVDVPTFLVELRDLPGMVASFGRKHLQLHTLYGSGNPFAKGIAERNLQYRFGLRPMASDLKKLSEFALGVEKRLEFLRRLQTGQRIRRRTNLGSDYNGGFDSVQTVWSAGVTVKTGLRTWRETQQTWATVWWQLADSWDIEYLRRGMPTHARQALREISLGLTPEGLTSSVWELTPWSWLIDWFTGLGDLLKACQNRIPVQSSNVCIMRRTTTVESCEPYTDKQSVVCTRTVEKRRTTKVRVPVIAISPFSISAVPLIGADRFSILSSLAIQRSRQ